MTLIFYGSIAISVLYGAFWCHGSANLYRVTTKTATTALLSLWALLAGGPVLLVAGLGLSALGDAFLGADDEDQYLLPGMAAFFAAHVAYIALFWAYLKPDLSLITLIAQGALIAVAFGFLRYIMAWVDKPMRGPVIAYTIIIAIMGVLALRLGPELWLATVGALAFTTSDIILSLNLFKLEDDDPIRPVTARLVWGLYYGGQALIAYAFVAHALAA